MLAVAARHLSILRPTDTRYAHTAMSLLSSACASYRCMLNLEITTENCDAMIGTSILIYCLSWCNLDFLEGQDLESPDRKPLDLSADQLFLLSPGVRHVFFTAWRVPNVQHTLFAQLATQKPCSALQDVLDSRGVDYEKVAHQFMSVFEDERFHGQGNRRFDTSSPDMSSGYSSPEAGGRGAKPPVINPALFNSPQMTDILIMNALALQERPPQPSPQSETGGQDLHEDMGGYFRRIFCYRKVVTKLAVIIALFLGNNTLSNSSPSTYSTPIFLPSRSDINRFFLSFPLIWLGPFLDLVMESDTRGLVAIYHFYRAARDLLGGTTETWWASERAVVMERLLFRELARRGFGRCLREEMEASGYEKGRWGELKCLKESRSAIYTSHRGLIGTGTRC
jgi:hypothetical protein